MSTQKRKFSTISTKTILYAVIVSIIYNTNVALKIASADERYGRFSSLPRVEFLPDGINVQLLESLTFFDSNSRKWRVPAGFKTNGASIPQFLWSAYPPFTGKYRIAAFIHDYYCVTEDRKWQQVHRVFYDAMRAAGVGATSAKVMYAAVYFFGPRWGGGMGPRSGPGSSLKLTPAQKKKFLKDMEGWIIKHDNPGLRKIERQLNRYGIPDAVN